MFHLRLFMPDLLRASILISPIPAVPSPSLIPRKSSVRSSAPVTGQSAVSCETAEFSAILAAKVSLAKAKTSHETSVHFLIIGVHTFCTILNKEDCEKNFENLFHGKQ